MKTYEQLMKHYWGKIVPMAEAAGINPWECVLHVNEDKFTDHPKFEGKPWNYTFALTVLEGKPVFVGDKVYDKINDNWYVIKETGNPCLSCYTWTPPTKKRTFMLGDKELPCPVNKETGFTLSIIDSYGCRCITYFESSEDSHNVKSALFDLLFKARDK